MHRPPRRLAGSALQLGSQASTNLGSSLAGLVIPIVGSAVVVGVRQLVTALVAWPIARPRIRSLPRPALMTAIALGVVLALMNLAFYEALPRLGLGFAVTIEYLGPLTVALLGSRRWWDALFAVGAASGVALLAAPAGDLNLLGVLFALTAAASWGGYILLTRQVTRLLPGLQGLAVASVVALIIVTPFAVVFFDPAALSWEVVGLLLFVGLLCSAIPYGLDTVVLRMITPRLYSIITACSPVLAAAFGALVLGERLAPLQLLGIVIVCVAAGAAVALHGDDAFPAGGPSAGGSVNLDEGAAGTSEPHPDDRDAVDSEGTDPEVPDADRPDADDADDPGTYPLIP